MEGYSAGDILKPGGGALFVCAFRFLPIWHNILAMVNVSYFNPVPVRKLYAD